MDKTTLEEKNRSMHGNASSKTKHIKDLQQEVKTLKGKVTTLTKQKVSAEDGVSSKLVFSTKIHKIHRKLLQSIDRGFPHDLMMEEKQ